MKTRFLVRGNVKPKDFVVKSFSCSDNVLVFYCVKSVHIRSFSGAYFPVFGLNTDIYRVFLRIQSKCGKIRTTKTLNTDTFHTVFFSFMLTIFSMVFWNLYCWLWIYHKVHPWYIQGYVVLFISFNNSNYWFTVRFSLKLIISEILCGNLGICFLGIYLRFFQTLRYSRSNFPS